MSPMLQDFNLSSWFMGFRPRGGTRRPNAGVVCFVIMAGLTEETLLCDWQWPARLNIPVRLLIASRSLGKCGACKRCHLYGSGNLFPCSLGFVNVNPFGGDITTDSDPYYPFGINCALDNRDVTVHCTHNAIRSMILGWRHNYPPLFKNRRHEKTNYFSSTSLASFYYFYRIKIRKIKCKLYK